MTVINKSALLPYSAAQMFALVDEIEAYPQFLPWCKSTLVHHRTLNEVRASIQVAKGGIQHSFTTLNRLQQDKVIELRLVEGPFRHLEGFWRFEPVGNEGCRIHFDLEFEFSNKLIALTVGPVLQKMAESFIDAFSKRAKEIYGQ